MDTIIEVDTQGLEHPISVLKIRRILQKMYPGEILRVIVTVPESHNEYMILRKDLRTCRDRTGDMLLDAQVEGEKYFYTIKKKLQN
tara:strand:- start:397 stop:654 length:258 start_codon:yes stop_codon:yes gene_type:complete